MAENYPTWEQVEKKMRQFWVDSYPREKIIEVKQTKKDLEIGTERVDNSVVEYQHVYYYGETIVTKPDGGKYLYPMRIAFYQIPGQTQWNFHYASPGTHKVLEEGKGEDPLKPTQEKFRDILKQYVELMVSKHFPASKWTDYCKANNVELKITKVDYKNPAEVADSLRFADTENPISFTFFVEGTYKDKAGSFKFRIENLNPAFRANLDGGFWGMGYHAKPVDQLTTNDLSELKQYLLETAEEPRKALEQYIPEASPRDKAIALMRDTDPNKRRDGVDSVKWIQGFADDEELVDAICKLLMDKDQSVVNYAKSMIDVATSQATKESTKKKIKAALEARSKADVASADNAKESANTEKEAQYKKWVAELGDPSQASSALNFLRLSWGQRILGDDEAMNGIINAWVNGKLSDARAYLDSVYAYDKDKVNPAIHEKIGESIGRAKKAAVVSQTSVATPAQQIDEYSQAAADFKDPKKVRDALKKIKSKRDYSEKIVKDDAALESLINVWLKKGEFDSSTRSDVRSFLDNTKSYSKDKLNPETLKKIEDAFKTIKT